MIGEISAIVGAFIWALSNILIKSASRRVGVLSLNAFSASAGALFLVVTLFATGKAGDLSGIPIGAAIFLVTSILLGLGLGDTLYFRSMAVIGVSRASPVSGVAPLFALLIALVFLGESLTWLNMLGTVLVVVGVFLVARSSDNGGVEAGHREERFRYEGLLLALAAALCWAVAAAAMKLAVLGLDVVVANAIGMPVTAMVLATLAVKYGGGLRIRVYGWRPLLLATAAGVMSMGVGMLLYLFAIQEAGVAKTVALSAISPIFAVLLSMIFLRERLTSSLALGTVLTIAGVWLIL